MTLVYIVDDDISVREGLELLLRSAGCDVRVFGGAREFMAFPRPERGDCLVLDLHLPDMPGPELQRLIAAESRALAVIAVTGDIEADSAREALRSGAVALLAKPFGAEDLLGAVARATAG